MTSMLAFLLECAAAGALVGTVVGVPMLAVAMMIRQGRSTLAAGTRADLLLLAGIVPALAAQAAMAAAAAPSIGNALGLTVDHCSGHAHHFHICFVHPSGLRPALAALGAFALALWVWRAGDLVAGLMRSSAQARGLERLGRGGGHPFVHAFPVYLLPAAKLCHATGIFRRRIIVSDQLQSRLSSEEFAGALAHEEAHLCRRDPLARALLAAAGLFVPPAFASKLRQWHREASEEACDAAAGARVGDGVIVAAALVKVAALQSGQCPDRLAAPAFGDHGLETRVRLLLECPTFAAPPSRWPVFALVALLVFVTLAITEVDALHHGAEHILGQIF